MCFIDNFILHCCYFVPEKITKRKQRIINSKLSKKYFFLNTNSFDTNNKLELYSSTSDEIKLSNK